MTYVLDSSVLVPALVELHPEHERALPWLDRVAEGEIKGAMATHTVAEVYATLTTLPVSPRVTPGMAARMIREDLATVQLVPLTASDYRRTVERMASLGLSGGVIYDALIACVADKIKADGLVTFNVSHFRRVWPEGSDRILSP